MRPRSILAIAVLAVFAFLPASASANEYMVEVCTAKSSEGGGEPVQQPDGTFVGGGLAYEDHTSGQVSVEPCSAGSTVINKPQGTRFPAGGTGLVRLIAPEGTRIGEVSFTAHFNRANDLSHSSELIWFVAAGGTILTEPLTFREDGRLSFPENGGGTFPVHTSTASAGFLCTETTGFCGVGNFKATITNYIAHMEDEFLPGVAITQLASRTLRGEIPIGFQAVDKGSGLTKVELLVDGKEAGTITDDNGGKCVLHENAYKYVQPCALQLESIFQLDTTKLAEGAHELSIKATDAAGLQRETQPIAVIVHNAPLNVSRPTIKGAAALGQKLVASPGQWAGAPTGFAFQWYRCPASVKSDEGAGACGAISGAIGPEYTTGKADLGLRDLVVVNAANAFGSEAKLSFPTDVIEKPGANPAAEGPVVSHLKLSRRRFRVGTTLSRGLHGAVLAFTSSRGGQMSIAIRKPRRHGKAKSIGKLVATIKAGRSRILLSGEIGKRRLRPGSYEAVVRVTDNKGSVSKPAAVRFRIIPG